MANQVQTTFSINAQAALAQLAQYQQALRNTIQLQTQLGTLGTNPGGGGGAGGGIGLGTIFGGLSVGAAGAAFLRFTNDAIQRTKDLERSNRLLASSATEAGLAYSKLVEQNRLFAESAGLTERAAASTTARIAQLAVNSGDASLQRIQQLTKAFADLGAARGIDSSQLQDLIGTILSGQDEGLNRLGIADPGKLQAEYAKQLGKTTEALTQQEKVQAAVNAVLEKAATFTGAAEARQASFEGQMARSTVALENFYDAMGLVITRQPGFSTALEVIARNLPGSRSTAFDKKVVEGTTTAADIEAEIQRRDKTLTGFSGGRRFGLNSLALLAAYLGGDQQGIAEMSATYYPETRQELIRSQIQQEMNAARLQQAQSQSKADDDLTAKNKREAKEVLDQWVAAEEARRKAAAEAAKAEQERVEKLKAQITQVRDLISGIAAQQNPFVAIFENAYQSLLKVRELTQGLGADVRDAAVNAVRQAGMRAYQDARISSALQSFNLASSAQDFRSGINLEGLSRMAAERRQLKQLQGQLKAIGAFERAPVMDYVADDAPNAKKLREAAEARYKQAQQQFAIAQASRDRQVIELTEGLNPARLDRETRELAASARERESGRVADQEREARDTFRSLNKILGPEGIKVVLAEGEQVVRIVNEAPGSATVTRRPSQSATDARYQ